MEQDRPLDPAEVGAGGTSPAPTWRWDVVGLPWKEAEPILRARGLTYTTVVTSPPNRPVGLGELRVVAEKQGAQGPLLVLAYREYQRAES